ncbi:hypothetical protein [Streptomyces niveus]|uniref:hypothetical protein n=1 Tax=Streptomyces niveus TaxID=193462 RepID=UPI0036E469D6
MPPLSLPEQSQQLRDLAHEFEALRARLRGVSYTPGTDALRQISPLLLKTQDLTATLLVRLGALANSPYTSVPGSHASLECLSALVIASTQAGNDLASALHANPSKARRSPAIRRTPSRIVWPATPRPYRSWPATSPTRFTSSI